MVALCTHRHRHRYRYMYMILAQPLLCIELLAKMYWEHNWTGAAAAARKTGSPDKWYTHTRIHTRTHARTRTHTGACSYHTMVGRALQLQRTRQVALRSGTHIHAYTHARTRTRTHTGACSYHTVVGRALQLQRARQIALRSGTHLVCAGQVLEVIVQVHPLQDFPARWCGVWSLKVHPLQDVPVK